MDRPQGKRTRSPPSKKQGTSAPSRSTNFASVPDSKPDQLIHRAVQRGRKSVDISNWTLTEHPTQQPIFSTIKIPAGTKLTAQGFYLLGLSNSGLAVPAQKGDTTLNVRSTTGMSVGDTVRIDTGSAVETRKIAKLGTAAGNHTTLWQPLPEGPVITIPAGSTNVPVTSTTGFVVGEKIALGYGATYPAVAKASSITRSPPSPQSASRVRKPSWARMRPPAPPTYRSPQSPIFLLVTRSGSTSAASAMALRR